MRRVAGKHHLFPRALGNGLRYGHKSLTMVGTEKHTILQGALDNFLKTQQKVYRGKTVTMFPKKGNPGAIIRKAWNLDERIEILTQFYKTFENGRFYPAFKMELNAARKAGKLR